MNVARRDQIADPIAKHAIVIGAGIAGLTAAKALSAHFESVTILERDALPERPVPRRGTPQARHVHALLAGGQKALAELFSGFEQAIECAGAVQARAGLDVMVERPGYDPFPQRDLGFDSFCLSRPLLEFMLKRAIDPQARISVRSHTRVVELLACTSLRYFRPRDWNRLWLFPWHRSAGSHVPYECQVEVRAAYMPDATRAVS